MVWIGTEHDIGSSGWSKHNDGKKEKYIRVTHPDSEAPSEVVQNLPPCNPYLEVIGRQDKVFEFMIDTGF
jgi:hypothetical protein